MGQELPVHYNYRCDRSHGNLSVPDHGHLSAVRHDPTVSAGAAPRGGRDE